MGNLCSVSISANQTISGCWDCVAGQANYTFMLEKNVQALSVVLEELRALRDDVNREVDRAVQQRGRPLSQVQHWLSRAEIVITAAEIMVRDAPQEIEKLCLGGCFSKNCRSGYKFGRRVANKLEEIAELKSKGVFDKVAVDQPIATMDVRPTEPAVGLESTFVKVWNLIKEEQVGMIGLYGLGGVGKTTLLTQINNKLCTQRPSRYDAVIWIVVSKDYTIENVQLKIGEKIHMSNESWKNKSSDEKAQDIYRFLSKKKFVLLLDDIWERLDFIKVGVPSPSQENGSKVVFTTRSSQLCGEMEAKEKIEVRCLGENEAWTLFQQKVGEETLNSHPDIPDLAKKVGAECRGLPLALIVIGRAMIGKKSPKSWEFAVEVLKNSAHEFERTGKELYPVLKFSYDNLPSETMRSCFLYCCLFAEDSLIEKSRLIGYWFCEGLLDVFESITRARMQGHDIIDSLLNVSLLEQDEHEDYVKMHDVIRDMALWIACECEATENRFFVKTGFQLTEVTEVGRWEGVRRMSLTQNRIECLTSTPRCPNLQTLFLNSNHLRDIANGFFQFMPNLRVLNMSKCGDQLQTLPSTISELVSLECLDLSWTYITELPIELKSLRRLKHLDLSNLFALIRIPRKLISSFSKLQVFRLYSPLLLNKASGYNFLFGDDEGLMEELANLRHLNTMSVQLTGAFALERFLSFPNLQRCIEDLRLWNFSASEVFNILLLSNMECLDKLALLHCESVEEMKIERESGGGGMLQTSLFPTNIPWFHSLRQVVLEKCGKLRDMTWLILTPNLRILVVNRCAKMEEIMSEEKLGEVADVVRNLSVDPCPNLERLVLRCLPELKSICWKTLPLLFLTKIEVKDCSKLKKLPLNSDSAKGNNLSIEGQQQWWEELEWEDEATRNAFLPTFIPV